MKNQSILRLTFLLFVLIFLIGCSDDEYKLHLTINGEGKVSLNNTAYEQNASVTYEEGTVVSVKYSTSNSEWEFDSFSGDLSGTTNPQSITMSSDRHVTAKFQLLNSVEVSGYIYDTSNVALSGVLVSSVSNSNTVSTTTNSSGKYLLSNIQVKSEEFSLSFSKTGYWPEKKTFVVSETSEAYTVVNITLEGINEIKYQLNVNKTGEGSVSPEPGTYTYIKGTTVILTAIPEIGKVFRGWQGDVVSTSDQISFLLDASRTLTAVFELPYASFRGQVTDLNNVGISNVKISAGQKSTISDTNGYYQLNQVSFVSEPDGFANMTILFVKKGYCVYSSKHMVSDQMVIRPYPQLADTCNELALILNTLKILTQQQTSEYISFDINSNDRPDFSEILYLMEYLSE